MTGSLRVSLFFFVFVSRLVPYILARSFLTLLTCLILTDAIAFKNKLFLKSGHRISLKITNKI